MQFQAKLHTNSSHSGVCLKPEFMGLYEFQAIFTKFLSVGKNIHSVGKEVYSTTLAEIPAHD